MSCSCNSSFESGSNKGVVLLLLNERGDSCCPLLIISEEGLAPLLAMIGER